MKLGNLDVAISGPGNRIGTLVSTRAAQLSTGLDPINVDVNVTVRKAVTVGEVLMFDMAQSDAAVGSATIGASDSAWRNVIAPTAAGLAAGYPLCVALAIIADNASGSVRVQGIVAADLAGTNVLGDQLVATTSGTLARALSGVGERVVAWAMAAGATEQSVYFDGLNGFGAVQNPLPTGIQIPNVDFLAANRTGTTQVVGDLVMLDMLQAQETANATLGDALSCWANVIVPSTAGLEEGVPMAVALSANVDNAVGSYRIEGIVDGKTAGTWVIGDHLVPVDAALTLDKTTVANERFYAIALEAGTGVKECWFRGIGGFGVEKV